MKTIDTIRVECACGERAQLPPELAGRRVRCTSCKAKIRVPGPRVESERLGRTSDSSRQGQRGSRSGSGSKRNRSARSGSGSKRGRARCGSGSGSGSGSSRSRSAKDAAARFTMPKRSMHTKAAQKTAPAPARDRAGEAHVQAIGVWYRIYAVLSFALAAFLLRNLEAVGVEQARAGVEAMAAIAIGAGAFMWWLGSSLMNFERWARNVLGVGSALGLCYQFSLLLLLPNGQQLFQAILSSMWLVATLWVLFGATSANVFREDYPTRDHEPVRWAASPFFWLPIATSVGWFLLHVANSYAQVAGQ